MRMGWCQSNPLSAAVLCPPLAGVGAWDVWPTHEARLRADTWRGGPTQRCVGLGTWLLPHRPFSQPCLICASPSTS